ncbi:hypothetical protein C8Q69DRAFT_484911 [Paecilomyces variotii]|uniref:SUN domain-containing protein n=1 Tax=Byssochlamys spectabilis TaxID=264951 RepID=A0A443I8K6_BYSSP|nr:hypothetical protein C8Q69DRAFT_484911 [Paecilomyces variotii]RWR00404.1 hypothetical protein C8Q69DRAFT_484911 [Paecilomyces variotii]
MESYLGRLGLLVLILAGLSWKTAQAGLFEPPVCLEMRWGKGKALLEEDGDRVSASTTTVTASTTSSGSDSSPTGTGATDHELDTESPLDNSNFLSFEDWKKQNLARVGQSAENVGRHRQGVAGEQENRRRPTGINNALDSLGEDAEIELDFAGFGAEAPESAAWGTKPSSDGEATTGHVYQGTVGDAEAEGVSRRGTARRKDAGTTCKERFNYASFDCAATVLKTNPQCTGSSSVLIENKDSYMLNECRAKDKFLILELCDDILVDTIVLANYEFFSSIFRTFRVSVSDRYPAKEWKELGVYEARNTREIQAFAVENPLIWARYVKIEFLTHYGNEFYCPVSLVRVHGTTMLEEYKHEGDIGRGEEEVVDLAIEQAEEPGVVQPTEPDDGAAVNEPTPSVGNITDAATSHNGTNSGMCPLEKTESVLSFLVEVTDVCTIDEAPLPSGRAEDVTQASTSITNGTSTSTDTTNSTVFVDDASGEASEIQKRTDKPGPSPASFSSWSTQTDRSEQDVQTETDSRPTVTATKEEQSVPPEPVKATVPQPPAANPTTQESFFKSVNKRLQMLESNSSLSLLYIEEQSRILRDAFNKVEKRQLAKTTTFLENLNTTVLNELKEFRDQYDHVWRSVAVQFEHQRIQYHQEIQSMASQLGVLADEIVFQKRISVIQSIFVLICFGLVLFSRNAVGSYMEFPSVQNMVRSRSYSLRSSSPSFASPSASPTSTRSPSSYDRKARHRRNISEDSQDSQSGPISPTIAYSPPTPSSDTGSPSDGDDKMRLTPESSRVPTPDPPTFRPGSSPPTLSGRPHDGTYVSPSDGIQSPCTKKLSDLKGKRFKKSRLSRCPLSVEEFVEKECIPAEAVFREQLGEGQQRWTTNPAIMEELKEKARKLGLWNMFLPKNHFSQGAGFSNLEYGLMAEYLGKSTVAPEATNNAAPDTGNMEVLAKYGNDTQKQQWLAPLLDGKIRSAFLMTEPDIASSDATNIQFNIRREGNEYLLNGSKWWSSGAGDPRCKLYIVMGKTDASNPDKYKQQSVILVPSNTPGITIHRMLNVYGYDDAPHGHGHISFKNVRVPISNIVLGEGRGFEIIQGRLGPGRIHHAMRTIGAAERAIEWLIARVNDERKKTFGQPLSSHGVILEWIAKSRLEIDAARLIVFNAAIKIDNGDAKSALKEIAQAKVLVPQTALTVIDRAVQAFGAAGVSQDTPLAYLWALIRTLRIADGPDEVHLQQLGRRENNSRKQFVTAKLKWQKEQSERLLAEKGFKPRISHL